MLKEQIEDLKNRMMGIPELKNWIEASDPAIVDEFIEKYVIPVNPMV